MNIEELQAAIDTWDDILTHHPNSDLAILTATLPIYVVLEAARLVANPNIEATARLLADHRGVDWADEEYMDACRRMAEQYVAAAFTPLGDK